jgi:hypothetical protein
MERQREPLVLEQHARMALGEVGKLRPCRFQDHRIGPGADHFGVQIAPLQPVQPGGAQPERREQPVELGERPAADQCQRAAGRPLEIAQDPAQVPGHADRARLALNFDQRAVDVEEQRDRVMVKLGRRRCGIRHALARTSALGRRLDPQ